MATPNEIGDPHQLKLWLKVNDQMRQNSTTAQMIFKIPHLVSYISQFMTLLPRRHHQHRHATGSRARFEAESVFLQPGDVVELGIEGLGTSRQQAVAFQ